MNIAHRTIGPDHPPLLIAEIGISHEGSIDTCRRLMDELDAHGVEAVKLQTHIAEEEMQRGHRWWDTIVRCQLSEEDETAAFRHAEGLDMICLSTPFSLAAVERLERIGTPAYKIGSGEAEWAPLLKTVNATGKPCLVSLGMSDGHIAYNSLRGARAFMHCVSEYPTPSDRWSMRTMMALESLALRGEIHAFGYSDHTRDPAAICAAATLGANVIEVHVGPHTSATRATTPDECVEWTPEQVGDLSRVCRRIWRGMRPKDCPEPEVAKFCRRDEHGRRMAT